MKILQVGKFYPIRGGVEKVMYDLTLGLSARGVECDMLCAAFNKKGFTRQLNEKGRLIVADAMMKLAATMISPAMIWKMRRIAAEYDIVHIHHPDPMAALALFCSGFKGKVVLHWHSDILKQKTLLKFYRPLQKWLLKRADVIVGTTPVYVKESPFLQDCQHKITHLPIGIHPMPEAQEEAEELRRQYPGKKIVFSLGRLVPYKGFCYLVEAAKHFSDDYVLLIGGTGPLKEELQSQIEALGLEKKVRLLGYVPDEALPAYFCACDLFCLSSVMKTEAFGIVQIEAMSLGKPVVATRILQSGVSWVNAHGESGRNVTPCCAEELADAIVDITHDEKTYRAYCDGARLRWQNYFTLDKMIDDVMSIYKRVL